MHPDAWWMALQTALDGAGGLTDVAAVAVGAQQHGMVCLNEAGAVVRPALLWNDTRSADAAVDLISELGGGAAGRRAWAQAVGAVPVASFTVTKLRWLAQHEPAAAARTAAVCLPHDWLTWHLGTDPSLEGLRTDRGDASGTGYWSAASGAYRNDLLSRALGHDAVVPRVLGPSKPAGTMTAGALLGPGTGDNAAAALGLDTRPGDVVVSIGTSGVACSVTDTPATDPSGTVAGFADATGRFLPLVATLNAARVLDAVATMLRVDHEELSRLALSAPPGADGLVVVPYLEGERTRTDRTPPAPYTGCAWRPRPRHTSHARRSRGCCTAWRMASMPWSRPAPGSSGCSSSVAARGPARSGRSPPPCWTTRCWCRHRGSTSQTGPLDRPRGP